MKRLICSFGLLFGIAQAPVDVSAELPRLKIGVSTSLTGDTASFGQDVRDILSFANKSIADNRYDLIFEDDKCSPKEGALVAQRFAGVLKLPYVIGLPCSASALAAAPIYERAGILTMVTWASSPRIAEAGDYVFRITPSDRLAAETLSKHIGQKFRRVALFSAQNDYAQDIKKDFVTFATSKGIQIATEDYLPKSSDVRSALLKLRQSQPEALFLNAEDEGGFETVMRALKAAQWRVPVFGAYWPSSPSLLRNIPDMMEGVEFIDTLDLSHLLNDEGKRVFKEYTDTYGPLRSSESTFPASFEAFRALDAAIQSGKDPREYLYSAKLNGIFGPYTFDANGDCRGIPFVVKRIRSGRIELAQ